MKNDQHCYKHVWTAPANDNVRACNCIGPQNGQPKCPCAMRTVKVVDGRYVETIDYGPITARCAV